MIKIHTYRFCVTRFAEPSRLADRQYWVRRKSLPGICWSLKEFIRTQGCFAVCDDTLLTMVTIIIT